MKRWIVSLWLACAAACSSEPPAGKPKDAPPPASEGRIGHVMVEVGHRLETSGRAARAGRWGLAEYEVHEIEEIFEDDMQRVLLPGDCNDTVADAMYFELRDERLPALRRAAHERDADAFGEAFAAASARCNGCHGGCQVSFVQVPQEPGSEVPRLEPVETAPAAEPAAPEEAQSQAPAAEPANPEAPAPSEPAAQ